MNASRLLLILLLPCIFLNSRSALAAEGAGPRRSNFRSVVTIAGYGAVAGTLVGLGTYPFSKSTRAIFIGTSVGLYLGIVAGIYHITHRDDPENPFNSEYVPSRYGPNGTFVLNGAGAGYGSGGDVMGIAPMQSPALSGAPGGAVSPGASFERKPATFYTTLAIYHF
ncbi:MAG: hypothetical protein H7222_18325 [Methylotenera sp.]|nr:hypothetical protein [Oligoflexia bacterium]